MSLDSLSSQLQKIVSDNTSGSRELLEKLNNYLSKNIREVDKELILNLKSELAEFQTIQKYLSDLEIAYKQYSLNEFFENFHSQRNNLFSSIYSNLKPEIERINSFLTISNSKTLLEIFKLISEEKSFLRIIVSESRPIVEGLKLAEELSEYNLEVGLITEAQIYDAVQKCECGIIGADKILANGNVVNKVGSNLIALVCKEFNKPFFVVTDKTKFSNDNSFDKKEKPAEEIYAGSEKINISNFYFEEIPKKLITKVITD